MSKQEAGDPAGNEAGSRVAGDGTTSRADSAAAAGVPAAGRARGARSGVPVWLDQAAGFAWRGLAIALALLVLLWLAAELALITLPLAVAVILTTLTVPPTRALQRWGFRPGLATTVVLLGGIALLAGGMSLLAPSFAEEIRELGPTIDQGRRELLALLADSPLQVDQQAFERLLDQAREQLSAAGPRLLSGALAGAAFVVEMLAGIALVLVLVFFFTKDGEQIVDWALARAPERHREAMRATGRRAWRTLGGYVRGTAMVAFIDAVGVAAGLVIIGVPLVVPLAILVFLGAFLPVVGAFVAGLIAVLVAAASGGLTDSLLTLGVIVLVQQVEGHVLQPVIMRRAVALHPAVVVVVLTAGATVGGIVGAFLAVPVTAVIAAVGNELRLRSEAAV